MQLSNSLTPRSIASSNYLLRQYGGAAAAYSLQRLDTSVENVVRARRSTDDAEADFTAQEVSGGSLREFALNNDADLIRFADQAVAADKRMYFDGVNDYVVLPQTAYPDFSQSFEISCTTAYESNGIFGRIWAFGSSASNSLYFSLYKNTNNTLQVIAKNDAGTSIFDEVVAADTFADGKPHTVVLAYNGTDTITCTIDGSPTNYAITPSGTFSYNNFTAGGWVRQFGFVNPFTGLVYDVSYTLNGTELSSYQGYGNTNADWEDQVGSNDGTVNGTPALFSGQGFDAYVTTLYDQSGNGRNATQATAASQPQIVADGVVVTDSNGNAALTHQTINSGIGLDSPITARNTYFECFAVYEAEAAQTQGMVMSDTDNANGAFGISQDGAATAPEAQVTGAAYRANGADISSATRDDLHTNYHTGSPVLINASGTLNDNTAWDGASIALFHYGGAAVFNPVCIWTEYVIFQTSQASNRAAIESQIASRYGIVI